MKNGTKFVLILAAVLAIVGVGLTIGGFAAGAARELSKAIYEDDHGILHRMMESGYFDHGIIPFGTDTNETVYDSGLSGHQGTEVSEAAYDSGSSEVYTGKGTYQTFIGPEENINEIVVEADAADLIVCSAADAKHMPDDETILVEVTLNDRRQNCYIDAENNELYIKETNDTSSTVFTKNLSQKYAEIKIYLPEQKSYGLFSVDADAGDITLKSNMDCDNVTIDLDAGDIKADHKMYVSGDMDIFCDVGDVEIDNIVCGGNLMITMNVGDLELYCDVTGNLDAQCDVGDMDIHLPGIMEDYNYDISVDTGELDGMGYEKGFGFGKDIQLTNNPSGSTIILQSNVGDVELHFGE